MAPRSQSKRPRVQVEAGAATAIPKMDPGKIPRDNNRPVTKLGKPVKPAVVSKALADKHSNVVAQAQAQAQTRTRQVQEQLEIRRDRTIPASANARRVAELTIQNESFPDIY
jgi:hypothetical protein